MKTERIEEITRLWKQYFGSAELPLACFYSDDQTFVERTRPVSGHVCMIGQLARVRQNGETLAFAADTFGCFGAARFCGFNTETSPTLRHFLSQGVPGKVEGERYKKTPALADRYIAEHPSTPARGRFIVFKRWDMLSPGDAPLLTITFATADVLSGLFTLANYARADQAVVAPFSAGCGTIVSLPLAECDKEHPHAILGMFDVSARPSVGPNILSFATPMALFEEMMDNASESFLETPAWAKVRKRLG